MPLVITLISIGSIGMNRLLIKIIQLPPPHPHPPPNQPPPNPHHANKNPKNQPHNKQGLNRHIPHLPNINLHILPINTPIPIINLTLITNLDQIRGKALGGGLEEETVGAQVGGVGGGAEDGGGLDEGGQGDQVVLVGGDGQARGEG